MSDRLDMTVTYAVHGALRRELRQLARAMARPRPDPRHVLRAAPGWGIFRSALHAHQAAEDEALWPPLRRALAGRPFDLTRLEAIEAEHAALVSLVAVIDGALADRDAGLDLLGELTGSLVTGLDKHLDHEEEAVFPLVQTVLSQEEWDLFGGAHARRIEPGAARILPWLLDGADARTVASVLAQLLPEPARHAYVHQWRPAYEALDLWGRGTRGALTGAR
ncbi:hemerythrin domain-containing protein [Streptomyces sp. NPDC046876]|uniref:hemerythrin domain-containing protein n=1 Tax=Streptomyces sp. NPDC046876 TaxID=3155616 RepID=UPI0033FDF192